MRLPKVSLSEKSLLSLFDLNSKRRKPSPRERAVKLGGRFVVLQDSPLFHKGLPVS